MTGAAVSPQPYVYYPRPLPAARAPGRGRRDIRLHVFCCCGDTGVDARPQTPRALEPNTHTQVPRAQAATAEAGAGNPENNCKKPYDLRC